MAKKKMNYTGRRKILRDHVSVEVRLPSGAGPSVAFASFSLDSYGFPADSKVIVEAHRPSGMQRERSAAVRTRQGNGTVELDLGNFADPADCRFAVRVIEPGAGGRLLGVAKQLVARDPNVPDGANASLLTVERADLGHRLWKLDLQGSSPVLFVSGDSDVIPNHREFVRDPYFLSIVLPDVLDSCLRWALGADPSSKDDHEEAWNWCQLGEQLAQRNMPNDVEGDLADVDEFVAAAVEAFCRRNAVRERYRSARSDGQ